MPVSHGHGGRRCGFVIETLHDRPAKLRGKPWGLEGNHRGDGGCGAQGPPGGSALHRPAAPQNDQRHGKQRDGKKSRDEQMNIIDPLQGLGRESGGQQRCREEEARTDGSAIPTTRESSREQIAEARSNMQHEDKEDRIRGAGQREPSSGIDDEDRIEEEVFQSGVGTGQQRHGRERKQGGGGGAEIEPPQSRRQHQPERNRRGDDRWPQVDSIE